VAAAAALAVTTETTIDTTIVGMIVKTHGDAARAAVATAEEEGTIETEQETDEGEAVLVTAATTGARLPRR